MTSPKHILIVDDEESSIHPLVKKIISARGWPFQLLISLDGYEALDNMQSNDIVAVVLDLQMSGLDGLEVCRKMQGYPHLKAIPVIISSGFIGQEQERELRSLGVRHFLRKPYAMEKLSEALIQVLGGP